MLQNRKMERQAGFSLLEVIIAAVIFSAVIVASMGMFIQLQRSSNTTLAKVALEERARSIIDRMSNDLRKAFISSIQVSRTSRNTPFADEVFIETPVTLDDNQQQEDEFDDVRMSGDTITFRIIGSISTQVGQTRSSFSNNFNNTPNTVARITYQLRPLTEDGVEVEPLNGIDDNRNGLIDEQELVRIEEASDEDGNPLQLVVNGVLETKSDGSGNPFTTEAILANNIAIAEDPELNGDGGVATNRVPQFFVTHFLGDRVTIRLRLAGRDPGDPDVIHVAEIETDVFIPNVNETEISQN